MARARSGSGPLQLLNVNVNGSHSSAQVLVTMSSAPLALAAHRHKLHSFLVQGATVEPPPPAKHVLLQADAFHQHAGPRGLRPASGRRETVGGGFAHQSVAGHLYTNALPPSEFALDLQARRPASARRSLGSTTLTAEAAGEPLSRTDLQLVAIAAAARQRIESVIWTTPVSKEHPSAARACTLCAMATDEYERELLQALRTGASSMAAASLRQATVRGAARDEGEAAPLPKPEPLRAEVNRHMAPSMSAWRRAVEVSGAVLHAALAAQEISTEISTEATSAVGQPWPPESQRPNSPVGPSEADVASLRALLEHEAGWVVARAYGAMAAIKLRAELAGQLRRQVQMGAELTTPMTAPLPASPHATRPSSARSARHAPVAPTTALTGPPTPRLAVRPSSAPAPKAARDPPALNTALCAHAGSMAALTGPLGNPTAQGNPTVAGGGTPRHTGKAGGSLLPNMGLLSQLPAAIEAIDIEAIIEAIWTDARLAASSAAAGAHTAAAPAPAPVRPSAWVTNPPDLDEPPPAPAPATALSLSAMSGTPSSLVTQWRALATALGFAVEGTLGAPDMAPAVAFEAAELAEARAVMSTSLLAPPVAVNVEALAKQLDEIASSHAFAHTFRTMRLLLRGTDGQSVSLYNPISTLEQEALDTGQGGRGGATVGGAGGAKALALLSAGGRAGTTQLARIIPIPGGASDGSGVLGDAFTSGTMGVVPSLSDGFARRAVHRRVAELIGLDVLHDALLLVPIHNHPPSGRAHAQAGQRAMQLAGHTAVHTAAAPPTVVALLLVVVPATTLPRLPAADVASLSALARALGTALQLLSSSAQQLRPPASRHAGAAPVYGALPSTVQAAVRRAPPPPPPSAASRCGDSYEMPWDAPSELPSLAGHLAALMETLQPEQGASLARMLTQHPQLGDAVVGHMARKRMAELRAAEEGAELMELRAAEQDGEQPGPGPRARARRASTSPISGDPRGPGETTPPLHLPV